MGIRQDMDWYVRIEAVFKKQERGGERLDWGCSVGRKGEHTSSFNPWALLSDWLGVGQRNDYRLIRVDVQANNCASRKDEDNWRKRKCFQLGINNADRMLSSSQLETMSLLLYHQWLFIFQWRQLLRLKLHNPEEKNPPHSHEHCFASYPQHTYFQINASKYSWLFILCMYLVLSFICILSPHFSMFSWFHSCGLTLSKIRRIKFYQIPCDDS